MENSATGARNIPYWIRQSNNANFHLMLINHAKKMKQLKNRKKVNGSENKRMKLQAIKREGKKNKKQKAVESVHLKRAGAPVT
jgi:ribosomal protein S6